MAMKPITRHMQEIYDHKNNRAYSIPKLEQSIKVFFSRFANLPQNLFCRL
jgi:hypothetical protein